MRKLSSRAVALITNLALVFIVLCVGAVCMISPVQEVTKVRSDVFYKGKSEKGVSLAINVYWGTEELKGMLDTLDSYGAKATFFIGGCWADDNVETVKLIFERGHEIGSHGYFHRDHDKLSYEQNVQEIQTSIQFITQVTGVPVTLFAPPSGAYNDDTVNAAASLGCKTVMWSKDTIDWRDKDAAVCLRRATEGVGGGDIVLMHPMPHTAEALPNILEYYKAHGLTPVTVGKNLLGE